MTDCAVCGGATCCQWLTLDGWTTKIRAFQNRKKNNVNILSNTNSTIFVVKLLWSVKHNFSFSVVLENCLVRSCNEIMDNVVNEYDSRWLLRRCVTGSATYHRIKHEIKPKRHSHMWQNRQIWAYRYRLTTEFRRNKKLCNSNVAERKFSMKQWMLPRDGVSIKRTGHACTKKEFHNFPFLWNSCS